MRALLGKLQLHKLFSIELNPLDSLPTFALSSIKGSTREDILIYIGVSLVGIAMAGVTALVIYLLTIMLTR